MPFGKYSIHNLLGECWFFGERLLRGFLALADQITLELQPRAFFVHDAVCDGHFENAAFLVDAVIIHDVELGLDERGATLFLTTLTRT